MSERDDDLVYVAGAMNQVEAEFIQGVLRQEGIPSIVRRARGVDVPDMLVAGRRDVLVRRSALAAARAALPAPDPAPTGLPASGVDSPLRIVAGLVLAVIVVSAIIGLGVALR